MRVLTAMSLIMWCGCSVLAAGDAASVVAQRREMLGRRPFASAIPRSNEPTGELVVLRTWPDPIDMRIAVAALQGIANRDRPRLYIGLDKPLYWLEYYGGKVYHTVEPDVWKVFERFGDRVRGIVVYDFSLDALPNVAITYAGIEDLIPATPALAEELASRFGWKTVHDLRGRWKTRYEAYRWAFENLFPRCDKWVLTHYNHGYQPKEPDPFGMDPETLKTGFMVDYAVEFRSFAWHVPGQPTQEEVALAEQIMQAVPLFTPIFGRSSTQDTFPEPAFVSWVAKFANLHIPAGMGNTSVLSGARLPAGLLKQKNLPAVRDFGPDKVYLAFTNSEHDNLEHVIGGGPPWHRLGMETDDPWKIWWSDPWRGRVPIGWPIGPLIADLAPTTLAHFTTTATDNDYLMAALSGLCLSDPEQFGSAYPDDQDRLLDEYVKLTGEYMARLGWTQLQPVGTPAILRHFAKGIPGIPGMMEGYGPHKGMSAEKAAYLLDGVPVFHALTEGTTGTSRTRPLGEMNALKAERLADEIKAIKVDERPAFLHIWTVGWDFGPTTLKLAADRLPSDYIVVRPDELAALFKKYRGPKAELASTGPRVTPSGTVRETVRADALEIDTGGIKVEIGWGTKPQPPIKRVMGPDGRWRGAGRLILNNPHGMSTSSMRCEKTKDTPSEKRYLLTYLYSNGGSASVSVTAFAGRPFVLIENTSRGVDLPSWGFDAYPGFQPDTLTTDTGTRTLDYKDTRSMANLPWSRWTVLSKTLRQGRGDGERDAVGILTVSFADWSNSPAILWQREGSCYWEFYYGRTGSVRFAVAVLDRNDSKAWKRIWNELNAASDSR